MKYPNESHFDKKLRKAAKSIKRESKGRKCGECRHLRGDSCEYAWDLLGYNLYVYTPDAVACKRWQIKPNGVNRAK